MNPTELRKAINDNGIKDEWWISVDGNVLQHPMSLTAIESRQFEFKNKEIELLHIYDHESGTDNWVRFEFPQKPGGIHVKGKHSLRLDEIHRGRTPSPMPQAKSSPEMSELAEQVLSEVKELKEEFNEMKQFMRKIETLVNDLNYITDMRTQLEEREKFLMESEEKLMMKAHEHERQNAELEQMHEDMGQTEDMGKEELSF